MDKIGEIRRVYFCEGHSELAKITGDREALVCFKATGGHKWRLWASLKEAGIKVPAIDIRSRACTGSR